MKFLTRTVVTIPPLNLNDEPLHMELSQDDPGKIIIVFGNDYGTNSAKYDLKNIYDALEYLQKEREEQTLSEVLNTKNVRYPIGGPLDD